ncbi:Exopolyphosphatase [Marasmius tenuissimus]|uniref:Exopolyphosphatase n=1 Tax=Marasmius tenuissimus TaxID=585030 RepID=A0ABR2ZZ52_9AGAR
MSTSATRRILADFLASSKQKYLSSILSAPKLSRNEWTVVMGNESGDLDTIACAIAYAYHQTHHLHKPTIPLIRIHRNDLKLRAENMYALALAGVNEPENQLLLLSDIPESKWPQREFALVDHNRLAPEFDWVDENEEKSRVVAVIDHHADEGLYKNDDHVAKPRLIFPAGSCASLVASYILDNNTNTEKDTIPPEISMLLLSAILIDTNLKPTSTGGKATELDFHAAAALVRNAIFPDEISKDDVAALLKTLPEINATAPFGQAMSPPVPSPSQDSESIIQLLRSASPLSTLSETLTSKKFDVSHLSVRELLKRDYKEYDYAVQLSSDPSDKTTIKGGLSTVPVGLTKWAGTGEEGNLDALLAEGVNYMSERGTSVLGVLTQFRKEKRKDGKRGKNKREMAWLIRTDAPSSSVADAVAQKIFTAFEESEEIRAGRHKKFEKYTKSSKSSPVPHARYDNLIIKVYKQGNAHATRKATAPVLRRALEEPARTGS